MNHPRYEANTLPEAHMNIEIKINKTSDINSFYENIFSENYIKKWGFVKKAIFHRYPELGQNLHDITDEEERKKIIYSYIDEIYTKNDIQIQTITQNLKSLFEKDKEKIIDGLIHTMDFDPKDIPNITIIPSLKPNSSFWPNKISLSIASELFDNKPNAYIDIFIHEITHIIWNQKIGKIYDAVWKLWWLAHEDLKEIITPILMRDSHFKNILQSEHMKNANEKQQILQINVNWIVTNIVDYFGSIYQNMKQKWNSFEEIMKEFVKIFMKIEDQIISKHAIYNEFWFVSKDKEEAKVNLIKKFHLTERQTVAILEMKLQQLANMERLRVEEELKEKNKLIKELEAILKSKVKILEIIKTEIKDLSEKYGDDRRTQVMAHGVKDFSTEDLVPNEEAIVVMTRDGYIKRFTPDTFKQQNRGGKGVIGLTTKEEDTVEFMFTTMTHADLLFFTTKGRAFQLKAYEIPVASRTAKGTPVVNFLQLLSEEKITSILPLDKIADAEYLFFATAKGLVKKVELNAFSNVRRSGLIAIKIKDDDKLIWVKPTSGSDHIQLVSAKGQAIRFKETDVRDMGRGASGVHGIRLHQQDVLIGMGVAKTDKEKKRNYQILTIMSHGFGKRTDLSAFKVQGRGGSGIKTAKVTDKTGDITNAFLVNADSMEDKDLIIISEQGQVIRTPFKSVNILGRDTQGIRIMRFKDPEDKVAGITWA